MAFVVPGPGGRDVTRAKNDMSVFMRGHGSVPFKPIPRRVISSFVVVDAVRIGVVATIRVREGRGCGLCGGILVCEVIVVAIREQNIVIQRWGV